MPSFRTGSMPEFFLLPAKSAVFLTASPFWICQGILSKTFTVPFLFRQRNRILKYITQFTTKNALLLQEIWVKRSSSHTFQNTRHTSKKSAQVRLNVPLSPCNLRTNPENSSYRWGGGCAETALSTGWRTHPGRSHAWWFLRCRNTSGRWRKGYH